MACHCREYTRSHLLRGAAAEAGRGLPAIEPGMPLPAGTGLNRRSFLLRSGAAMLSVYGASKLGFGGFDEGIAQAAARPDAPVLVSVFLDGGADSLSILAPTTDSTYRRLRGDLAVRPGAGTEFSEDDRLRWAPSAASMAGLHEAGKVTVFPGIGYASPDQSHFTSRHYWEVGELNTNARTGWMGRLIDAIGTDTNPLQGLSLDGWLSPALATNNLPVAAVDGTEYDFWTQGVWDEHEDPMFDAVGALGRAAVAGGDPGLATAGATAERAASLRSDLKSFTQDSTGVRYPNDRFADRLAGLASMLGAGLPIRCAAISAAGGYDTHDSQAETFDRDIKLTFDSIAAFQADLEARGLDGRVLTLVWSEFGRRPESYGGGTDHGAGGSAFLVGSRAAGQMVGEFPGLDRLDADDNLRSTSDFRAMYCSLLEQWFGVDAAGVIPGASGFERPVLIS